MLDAAPGEGLAAGTALGQPLTLALSPRERESVSAFDLGGEIASPFHVFRRVVKS
jgi:hypothetical protein